jgi:membrane fusion protein, multidrug efflux system
MDLFLNGLGTATAFKTVTVRSRVEGELLKVHFTEGQKVREGELLAEIDPRAFEVQRDQAEGQLARDEATLKVAKLTLDRYQDLFKSNVVVQQQLDDQAALVQQTEGSILANKAMLANARLQLSYCQIAAPIGGRIGLRLVDQGNYVRANDAGGLAVITQLQPIAVVFTIPQDEIARVLKQSRDDQILTVDAYDRDFKTKLASGKLAAIDNQVDPTTGTLRLKAVFENEDQLLFPNQFVNARLLVDTKREAIVVPSAAVQRGPTSTFVYVVRPDEYVDKRDVVMGPSEGNETSIESGLTVGEVVVTDGIDKLQPWKDKEHPGTKVSIPTTENEREKRSGAAGSPQGAGEKNDSGQKGTR